jgi:hypothetical protein
MASAELSRRVEQVVGYPSLSEMGADQRREFHEALLADSFEDLRGKWQAAILTAEQNRPKLRVVSSRPRDLTSISSLAGLGACHHTQAGSCVTSTGRAPRRGVSGPRQ